MRIEVELDEGATHADALKIFEAKLFVAALNESNCNRSQAAKRLGIAYNTFLRKLGGLDLTFQAGLRRQGCDV